MPTARPEHNARDGADPLPTFLTDDFLASRLRRLEQAALELGAADIRRELAKLACALERGFDQLPERENTLANLSDQEILEALDGDVVIEHREDVA